MKRKMIASILTAVMTMSILGGCGSQTENISTT